MNNTPLLIAILFFSTTSFSETTLEKGKYIFMASGCMNCHSPDKSKPLAGGLKIATDFGDFYTPNISSDPKFGIGNWSDKDFLMALRKGISPKKQFYYPSFPFTSYSKLSDEDILAMKTYIMSLPPQAVENKKSVLKSPYNHRALMFAWRALNFKKHFLSEEEKVVTKYQGVYKINPNRSESWNRGAYLVEGALHCTECHTPRNALGGLVAKKWMSGALFEEKEVAGNLTSDLETGKGAWGSKEWETFLSEGETPEGEIVSGEMWQVIKNGTSKLTDSDRADVAVYLQSLKAVKNTVSAPLE